MVMVEAAVPGAGSTHPQSYVLRYATRLLARAQAGGVVVYGEQRDTPSSSQHGGDRWWTVVAS